MARYGGNPGRGGHRLSMEAAAKIFEVRQSAAEMFGAEVENTAFTPNCTFALNMAIKGIMQYGGHMIISSLEHNAVARPVYALQKYRGAEYSVAEVTDDDDETVENFRRLIRYDTKCVCATAASNVTGKILPYKAIGRLCRENGICFIGDCAQACGVLDISLEDGFNFICTAGHKSLYGPTGTGLLISDGSFALSTIIEGGTGTTSASLEQTDFLPERLESGTINTVGIIGLGEGLKFVRGKTCGRIAAYEERLCQGFTLGIRDLPGVKLYRTASAYVPIVAFNIGDIPSQELAQRLSDKGFALRGGLHCAALAHEALGTTEQGAVRFSPSAFNHMYEVNELVRALKTEI